MNDIKSALAQLRAARNVDEQPADTAPVLTDVSTILPIASVPASVSVPAQISSTHQGQQLTPEPDTGNRSEVKTLAGRVPLSLHRELTRALLDAADELRFSRINVDEALEAAMKVVLRDPQATALWYAQLKEVRKERREG
jgi:hypothetical protein